MNYYLIFAILFIVVQVNEMNKLKIFIYGDSNTWGYVPTLKPYSGDDSKTDRYPSSSQSLSSPLLWSRSPSTWMSGAADHQAQETQV